MSKLTDYRVLRQHDGDRFYNEGETRTARSDDVQHLIPKVLEEIGPSAFGGDGDHDDNGKTGGAAKPIVIPAKAKADRAPLNKAVAAAPANKAARSRKSKAK